MPVTPNARKTPPPDSGRARDVLACCVRHWAMLAYPDSRRARTA